MTFGIRKSAAWQSLLVAPVILLAGVAPLQAHAQSVSVTSGVGAVGQGARALGAYIQGTGFETGAVASISGTLAKVAIQDVFSSTTMYGYVSVSPLAETGIRNLTVTNRDGSSGTCFGCVTIDPAPTVTGVGSLEAGAGEAGYYPVQDTVDGSGFIGDVRVFIHDSPAVRVWSSSGGTSTEAGVALVTTPGAAPGNFGVTVTNGDGGVGRCSACFRLEPGPEVNTITPDAFVRGNSYAVSLSGQYFDQGARVYVSDLHGGITVSDVSVSPAGTSLSFNMKVGPKTYLLSPGIWLYVINPAPGYGSIAPIELTVTKSCGTTTC